MDDDDGRNDAQRIALSRAVAITGITATLSFPLAFYARSAAPDMTSVPLIAADGRLYYLLALVVALGVGVVIQALETDDPLAHTREPDWRMYRPGGPVEPFRQPTPRTAWMLPIVTLLVSYAFLAMFHRLAYVVLVPLVAGAIVFASRVARFHVMNVFDGPAALARIGHSALTYGVSFAALTVVYMFKARTLYSGSMAFLLSFLLLMQLTDGIDARASQRMLFAAAGALGIAELTWALNYWNTSAWVAGAMLATGFVFVSGVILGRMSGNLSQSAVVGRAAVALPILAALAYLAE